MIALGFLSLKSEIQNISSGGMENRTPDLSLQSLYFSQLNYTPITLVFGKN